MEERKDFGHAAIQGTAWRFVSYFGGKFMVFLSTIFLARLLAKDDFGIVGYALTAVALLDVASDLGVAEAVVYFEKDNKKYSTAFWISLIIGLVLFGLSWILAPLLVIYFRDDRVLEVSRVMALTFPLTALGSTHEAILRKNLAFERTTVPVFLRAVGKGLISIVLALMGFGAWSLVWGQLGGTLISSILLLVLTPWRPSLEFDFASAKSLLSFGVKDIGANFLAMILLNLDYWLVGRYLGAEALGVYTLAYRLPELLILQFARIISQVNFPIYTKMRETNGSLARGFWKTTAYVSLLTIPLGIGLALLARPFTIVFLSEKWLDAVPVLQGIALYAMFLSLIHNATSAYKAEGNFRVITGLSVVRLLLLFPALFWATSVMGSIVVVGWTHAGVAFLSAVIGLIVAARMLRLPLRDLFASIWPAVLAGISMGIVVYIILGLASNLSAIQQLLLTVPAGAFVYVLILWFSNRELMLDVIERLRSAVRRRQGKYA
ncbi:MAG TPA: lipopolysaccharide biosynthesis protein [Anaerolineales bacterium]|nr:lipopolysaccharide biosynthesis protein [Anaerolineales bacterium]